MKHIVSFSGGKDSTAMLIEMIKRDYKIDRIIFVDPLYEFKELYKYIEVVQEYITNKLGSKLIIETIKAKGTIEEYVFSKVSRGENEGIIKGWPLVAFGCSWSRDYKQKLLEKECKGNYRYIGIAVDEQNRVNEENLSKGYIYPLVDWRWTETDCIEYLKDLGLHNELYERFDRLGCWWCPKQSLKSLKSLYKHYPDEWDKLIKLDNEIKKIRPGAYFKPNYELSNLVRRFDIEIMLEENQVSLFEEGY